MSAGTNSLLRQGATPATGAADVLESIGIERAAAAPRLPDDGVGKALVDALAEGASTLDELSRTTGLQAGELAGVLAILELEGIVSVDEGIVRSTIAR